MGAKREVLGYVVVMKAYRKHGNGAVGSGRKGSSGKKCSLYKIDAKGTRTLVARAEGPTAKNVLQKLRSSTQIIPHYVAINHKGETYF